MAEPLLQTHDLTKSYGRFRALHPVNLRVQRGEVFGLVGPNGAGKSTLIRVIMGFLRPSGGRAEIAGLNCYAQRLAVHRQVAYLPGEVRLFRSMRGWAVLEFLSQIRGDYDLSRAHRLAERLQVDLSRRVAACSSGMRQKLALVSVFAARSPLLILDEPTTHLDPSARLEILRWVREARDDGQTVLFSSHIFQEVEDVCDRVAMLRQGELIYEERVERIRDRNRLKATATGPVEPLPTKLRERVQVVSQTDNQLVLETPGDLTELLPWLANQPLQAVRVEPLGLQALYEQLHTGA